MNGSSSLTTGNWDETVRIWDVASGERVQMLQDHQHAIYTVACLSGQTVGRYYVVSGSSARTIWLWNGMTGETIATLTSHQEVVCALACQQGGC